MSFQYDLYGGVPPHARASDTSRAAAESVVKDVTRLRRAVLDAIGTEPDGLTCDQVEERLGIRHQTASARVRELAQLGLIIDTGERRKTRSGRSAAIWKKV